MQNSKTFKELKINDKVGSISMPGQFASDNAGVVVEIKSDRFCDKICVVKMENGSIEEIHGLVEVGIGWYHIG